MGRIFVAGIVVCGFGLIGGSYVGPSLLCAGDCTAAPLNGLLTAPLGLGLGVLLGAVAWMKNWLTRWFAAALAITSLCTMSLSAALSWPEARLEAQLIEAEIAGCHSPATLAAVRVSDWRNIIAAESSMTPREAWESDVPRMLDRNDGVVLTLEVHARRGFYRRREPWRHGRIDASRWRRDNETMESFARFRGSRCDAYPAGERSHFRLEWEASSVSPPDILPTFLGLHVIEPVSADWRPR